MHESPSANVHVKRRLSKCELSTIAVALEMLARVPADENLADARIAVAIDDVLLADDDMRRLAQELTTARKVKVCRSKRTPA